MEKVKRISKTKVYKIRIETSSIPNYMQGVWYARKDGQIFTALLISKEMAGNTFLPRFLVFPEAEKITRLPSAFQTVRPEDCRVIDEVLEEIEGHVYGCIINICKPSKEDARNGSKKSRTSKKAGTKGNRTAKDSRPVSESQEPQA